MAKEIDEQSLREYGRRKRRVRRIRNLIILVLLLIIAIVGAIYLYKLNNKDYHSFEEIKSIENTGENVVGYLNYGNAVIRYSRDGAVAIDKDGSLIWNGSYEMLNPIVDTCGKYVVIADQNNKLIHIFNEKGAVSSIPTLYNILKVEIASQGVVAALMEEGDTNYIILYDTDGTVLGEKETYVSKEGFPIDITLSDDGEKLVTSYLSTTKGEIINTVAFLNFGEVGQNYTGRFVGGYEFEDMIIPKSVFLDNDTVCVFKEDGFLIYSMPEIPNLIYEENLDGTIKSILYDKEHIGIVLEESGTSSKRLLLYNNKGQRILERELTFDYHQIYLAGDEVIMHDNQSVIILKLNGKEKFRYTFDKNFTDIYPMNHLNRYFLVSDKKISTIALVE
ncbi:hypothetical protein H0486_17130 [Lachnospiraceae bacterium MD1]|jgi:hypothetical protein|uniref:6-bladed beta-propeller n=1 Tax=Variimorphobacter saccharofermentans TaxID=2755051 RepID=A0A839K5G4_9FIRM|nr:DUF5711 family protein [Variimorphobacter saccharofermentans]MBB2184598.1 hypothetical protein [Variimorphobacter saccharofermentans]